MLYTWRRENEGYDRMSRGEGFGLLEVHGGGRGRECRWSPKIEGGGESVVAFVCVHGAAAKATVEGPMQPYNFIRKGPPMSQCKGPCHAAMQFVHVRTWQCP